jgi:hypothetical protein
MNTNKRSFMMAGAFAVAVSAAVTGATVSSGQTRETTLDQTCAHATWPLIPAQCLEGADGRTFRTVHVREPVETNTMAMRFALAFN